MTFQKPSLPPQAAIKRSILACDKRCQEKRGKERQGSGIDAVRSKCKELIDAAGFGVVCLVSLGASDVF
jgi:hypothetical protein